MDNVRSISVLTLNFISLLYSLFPKVISLQGNHDYFGIVGIDESNEEKMKVFLSFVSFI